MGTIEPYETASGRRWRVRFRKPDHQQTTRRGFRTKRDADLFLASVEVSKARGEFIEVAAARRPVGELGPEWLSNRTHLKPSSLRPLEIAWRVYVEPRWGRVPVSSVRHSDVQAWVTEISTRRGPSTVLRAYGVLASILDTAVADRRILANPARGVKLPRKVRRPHAYLSHDQVSSLAIAAASMTLDVYSDLFDDDLDALASRLDEGLAATDVVKMWSDEEPENA